jgi:glutathione S-transferase
VAPPVGSRPIYHCSLVSDWELAQRSGTYAISSRGRTLEQEGFVHASYAEQVPGVLQRFYADLEVPLCLLVIDPELVAAPVVAENLTGGDELFPHVYGPIPVAAVSAVIELPRDASGWQAPDL